MSLNEYYGASYGRHNTARKWVVIMAYPLSLLLTVFLGWLLSPTNGWLTSILVIITNTIFLCFGHNKWMKIKDKLDGEINNLSKNREFNSLVWDLSGGTCVADKDNGDEYSEIMFRIGIFNRDTFDVNKVNSYSLIPICQDCRRDMAVKDDKTCYCAHCNKTRKTFLGISTLKDKARNQFIKNAEFVRDYPELAKKEVESQNKNKPQHIDSSASKS